MCLRSGETADEVDVEQRRLHTVETWLPRDELMFVIGSWPSVPSLLGRDRPQVTLPRTLAGVERILAISGPTVVIDSRILGVEAVATLRCHGGGVTPMYRGSGLMAPLTDVFTADELR